MALWRFLKVLLAAFIIFLVVNFFLSNASPEANSIASQISFKFSLPPDSQTPFLELQSINFSVGYLLVLAFCLGMIFAALIGALNAFSRSRELKMKKKTIHELEKEIDELRDLMARERQGLSEEAISEASNRLPEEPEIH